MAAKLRRGRRTRLVWAGLLLATLLPEAWGADAADQPKPTLANIAYGPHERQVLDFWQAAGTGARPLLVFIHGGGWITGDKGQKMPLLKPFLDQGISCAAINYRLAPEHPLPAPVHDAARAVQFLRFKAREWQIDETRIGLTGPSAGACTSMWLLLHDDLANPRAEDPVLRQSTRVCAAAVQVGQTSIDPRVLEGWLGPQVLSHPMIPRAVGEITLEGALRNYEMHRPLYAEFSPINHVDAHDPPLFLECSAEMDLPARDAGHGIHHPLHGVKLKESSDRVGHECHLMVPGHATSPRYSTLNAFLFDKLLTR
ncbi:MAG TPA: lipase [Planctomycetaceae bacterium]|nr:lipase [Planctomycetaceae bacterium]